MKDASDKNGGRLNRDDWLKAAVEAIVSGGVDQVKVQVMARNLGVSRSSFYWFFKSRQDLLDQLLAHWQATNTAAIVERAERLAPTPCRSVLHVFECWVREEYFNPRLDIAIRDWARKSEVARRAVDQADEERVRALTRMFERHGYGAPEAFIRARVLYYMQIGYYSLAIEEPMETRLGYVAHYLRVFTGMEPSEKEIADFRAFLSEVRDLDEPLPIVPD